MKLFIRNTRKTTKDIVLNERKLKKAMRGSMDDEKKLAKKAEKLRAQTANN